MRFIHRLIHMFSALLAQFPSRKGEIFLYRARVDIRSLFSLTLPSPDGRGFLVSASLFKKINVGVGSKPTLLCNHARKGIRRGRRPFSKKINVGVGSKPALLCNHARKGIHKVRSQLFFPRHMACTTPFFPHPTLSRRARVFGFGVPFLKKINVGVGSKPTLLCNHTRKGIHKVRSQPFFVRHIASTISFSPHPNPLPKGDGFWFRRPFLKKLM